jgi:flagellar biosynthesis/type III secretory pathway protein FliH
MSANMSDFQKQFLAKGIGNKLFTQEEFDAELQVAQAEIVAMAIQATREAVVIEREECAKIVEAVTKKIGDETEGRDHIIITLQEIAEDIRNRIPAQRQ